MKEEIQIGKTPFDILSVKFFNQLLDSNSCKVVNSFPLTIWPHFPILPEGCNLIKCLRRGQNMLKFLYNFFQVNSFTYVIFY